jgi:phage tail tube protein FII
VWEPFQDWVYEKHPKKAEVMYALEGTYTALSVESNRLWERYTKAWVKVVNG